MTDPGHSGIKDPAATPAIGSAVIHCDFYLHYVINGLAGLT